MFWQDSEQYYNTQYSILAQPRPRQARRAEAAAAESPALQRHRAAEPRPAGVRARGAADARRRPSAGSLARRGRDAGGNAGRRRERASRAASSASSSAASNRAAESDAAGRDRLRLARSGVRRAGRDDAGRGVRAAEPRPASRDDQQEPAVPGEEVAKQEKKVTEAEAAMARYRDKQNALSLEDRTNIVGARLNTLNDTATRARTNRLQKEARYNQLKAIDPKNDTADGFPRHRDQPGRHGSQDAAERHHGGEGAAGEPLSAGPSRSDEGRRPDRERAGDARRAARRA